MRPGRRALLGLVALLAVGAAASASLAPPAPLQARFAHEDCRRTLPRTAGVEDLAPLPGGLILLSAYDRRDEAAARRAGRRPSDGALYAFDPEAPTEARRLTRAAAFDGGFRPHGTAVGPEGRVAAVNRRYQRATDGSWALSVAIELFDWSERALRHLRTIESPMLCAANDLAFAGPSRLLVTLDRGDCEGSLRETLFAGGGLLLEVPLDGGAPRILQEGLDFANGVLARRTGWMVAETRGEALSSADGRTPLPGGPDNLVAAAGGLTVALHPSLPRLALFHEGWLRNAPSRIALVSDQGDVEILFDDPHGRIYSGATAALLVDDRLVIGGAREQGVLICEARA